MAEMVLTITPAEGSVLDFGCGKNAVLEGIIKKQSCLNCDSYDPQFNQIIDFSIKKYDTIVLCEVIEHLRNLQEELALIKNLMTSGGKVIIRTQKYSTLESFPTWWYRQDNTHINFFNDTTLSFAGSLLNRKCIQTPFKDIAILQP
jgi:cyclopropane fatty-acyl-phospholipid synthase-like methyltransferase